jgi:hypothetical protein
MKTEDVEELSQRTDYDNMSDDELRWLKDHNKLPAEVELKYFRANIGSGGSSEIGEDVPNPGDVDTRNMGLHPDLRDADLSGIDRQAEKDQEIERLKRELEQVQMERDALASDDDEGDDDEEDVDYHDMTLAELHTEIDARNAERANVGLDPLSKPSSKAKSAEELERDDDERGE